MGITLEALVNQLNQLEQQQVASANMAQQCAGAIQIIRGQIAQLNKEQEEQLKKEAEAKLAAAQPEEPQPVENSDGEANIEAA